MDLLRVTDELCRAVEALRFEAPVAHVYNPLTYARAPLEEYLRRYGAGQKRTLLLGMNPGPFGMLQTGVPFGDVTLVRDWLGIEAPVERPAGTHPKRPVQGFDCRRSEVSGTRLWSWARDRFGAPEAFFSERLVVNYCPLAFLEAGGRNRTPDKLPKAEREALFAPCDEALRATVRYTSARWVVGIGAFAEARARAAIDDPRVRIGRVLHPSPASPRANKGWAAQAEQDLEKLGIL